MRARTRWLGPASNVGDRVSERVFSSGAGPCARAQAGPGAPAGGLHLPPARPAGPPGGRAGLVQGGKGVAASLAAL